MLVKKDVLVLNGQKPVQGISVPILQCEESENIPLPDLPEQPENVQRPGSEGVEKGMLT